MNNTIYNPLKLKKIEEIEKLGNELLSKINVKHTSGIDFIDYSPSSFIYELLKQKDESFKEHEIGEIKENDFIQNLKHNKKIVVEFALAHPEYSYDVLYYYATYKILSLEDFANYTNEEVEKIPSLIRECIEKPKNIYKLKAQHKIDSRLLSYIPPDNLWESFEWIAEYAPDKFKILITKPDQPFINPFKKSKIVERYSSIEDKSQIPQIILDFVEKTKKHQEYLNESKEIRQQKKLELKKAFLDKEGNLLKLFNLADGFPITSADDYLYIANYFRNSNLSVTGFCKKFKINNISGFKKMCEYISLTDSDFADFYKSNLEIKKNSYLFEIKNQIEDIALKNIPLDQTLATRETKRSLDTIMRVGQSIVDSETLAAFVENIINYYYNRINSYDQYSTDEEEILKHLTNDEIKFLIPSETHTNQKSSNNINLGEEFVKTISPTMQHLSPEAKNKVYNRKNAICLIRAFTSYLSKFDYNDYRNGGIKFIMPDGKLVPCTPEMVDMADAYASKHKLFKSENTMSRIVKAIAEGKIQNQAETEIYKQNLQKNVLAKIKECKTLAEYFDKYSQLY